ncbi:hypothetical protein QP117_09505, partial [Actinotignum timonense]|uniref:hypothetical protein n=1 Tax=Actinotignum timonense TaxID=1870995 RepID=UPI00254A4ADC
RRPQRPSSALDAKASTECPTKLNKTTQQENKDAHNHYTNHKQPTTHTTTPQTPHKHRAQQKREAATCEPKRSNGVEREPDSVSASMELAPLFSTKKHPRTHTHQEKPSVNTCEHKKHTPHTLTCHDAHPQKR